MAGYKINPQKPTIFLYLGNEHMETEIEDRITFKIYTNSNFTHTLVNTHT